MVSEYTTDLFFEIKNNNKEVPRMMDDIIVLKTRMDRAALANELCVVWNKLEEYTTL